MARPKKQDHEKRTEQTKIRWTLAELEWLDEQARKAGMNRAEFIRRRSMSLPVVASRPSVSDPGLVTELNRIGVNLNQIAKAMNAGRALPSSVATIQHELQTALRKVLGYGA